MVAVDEFRAEALRLDKEIGDFQAGKAADLVYLRPEPGTALAAAVETSEDLSATLAALITLGDRGCIRDVRVEGVSVFKAAVPS